jgi:SpoVK/Ycf46/Vps4 family AAA+-type ATPase
MTLSRGVYLFDEFDAIGAHRGSAHDVGEIRRVLNSFLQFLEQDDSDSLILAATNYEKMLDEALFRRFDDVVRYHRPTAEQIRPLVRNRLQKFMDGSPVWTLIAEAAEGLSHAEIAKACDDAAKNCILRNACPVETSTLVSVLRRRRRTNES